MSNCKKRNLWVFLTTLKIFTKPVRAYGDGEVSPGWINVVKTPLEEFVDDFFRYGIGVAIHNLVTLWKMEGA